SPCFEGWPERAPLCAATCMGRKLTAPAAAETARTLRRVGDVEFLDMVSLLGSGSRPSCSCHYVSQFPAHRIIGVVVEMNARGISPLTRRYDRRRIDRIDVLGQPS